MNTHAAADHEHSHPTAATYVRIAVVLFILTALEVYAYELAHHESGALAELVKGIFVPALIVLSAAKFILVGAYYMHLKTDDRLLSWVFLFSLLIATVVIVGLMVLFKYLFNHGI